MPRTVLLWARALAATRILQTVRSSATFSIPLLGSVLTVRAGLSPETIRYIIVPVFVDEPIADRHRENRAKLNVIIEDRHSYSVLPGVARGSLL